MEFSFFILAFGLETVVMCQVSGCADGRLVRRDALNTRHGENGTRGENTIDSKWWGRSRKAHVASRACRRDSLHMTPK
jgi:hypothetical protein